MGGEELPRQRGLCLQRSGGRKGSSVFENLRKVHAAYMYPVEGEEALEGHPWAVDSHRSEYGGGEVLT